MDPLSGAVVLAGLGVAKPIVETSCELMQNLLGKPFLVAGDILADQALVFQWRNRVRMAHTAKELMAKDGIAVRVIPEGFLRGVLDGAGWTEDDHLQVMWARLLVAGVRDDYSQHPAFVGVLKEFSGTDARILKTLYILSADLDESLAYYRGVPEIVAEFELPEPAALICMRNLLRLGVCISNFAFEQKGIDLKIALSPFGRSLCDACVVECDSGTNGISAS